MSLRACTHYILHLLLLLHTTPTTPTTYYTYYACPYVHAHSMRGNRRTNSRGEARRWPVSTSPSWTQKQRATTRGPVSRTTFNNTKTEQSCPVCERERERERERDMLSPTPRQRVATAQTLNPKPKTKPGARCGKHRAPTAQGWASSRAATYTSRMSTNSSRARSKNVVS